MEPFSREIQEHQFSSAMRGYGRVEVDAFLTKCAGHMGALEERLRITEVRAARSEEELAGLRAEIDVLLQDAMEARRTIIEEAKAEAMAIVHQSASMDGSDELPRATASASAIVSEAETAASLRLMEVERLREAAEDDATAIVRRAEETAALTQAEARPAAGEGTYGRKFDARGDGVDPSLDGSTARRDPAHPRNSTRRNHRPRRSHQGGSLQRPGSRGGCRPAR
ncbi:MAG: DivIVA domain-containing protein [Acidimicrobiia bacterium]